MRPGGACEGCGNDDGPYRVCLDCLGKPTLDELAKHLAKELGGSPVTWADICESLYV